jgi:succinate dehydrogenase/fumarate reductase-like Fe-S protein
MTFGSFVQLGYYFFRQLVLRMIGRSRGLAQFAESYCHEDRLLPMAPDDRHALRALSRCIACGMCDAHFNAYARVNRAQLRGPSELPLSHARSLPDYDALHDYLRNLAEGDLARLEQVCPTRVPFRHLAEFAARRASDLAEPTPCLPS